MDMKNIGSLVYKIAAVSNFIVTIPAFFAYDAYVGMMVSAPPNYPFLVWIWSGMALLWGIMFWEISRDIIAKYSLIKYSYMEKAITSASVLIAFISGNAPLGLFIMIIFTDIIWIPIFIAVHRKVAILKNKQINKAVI